MESRIDFSPDHGFELLPPLAHDDCIVYDQDESAKD